MASGDFDAGDVHDVDRHAQHVGDRDGAVGGFALDHRRARQRVAFGAGDAHRGDFLLQQEHQFAVLGVHGGHGAEFERSA